MRRAGDDNYDDGDEDEGDDGAASTSLLRSSE